MLPESIKDMKDSGKLKDRKKERNKQNMQDLDVQEKSFKNWKLYGTKKQDSK